MTSTIISYIIRSGISLGILYLFFEIFLSKEKIHGFNRYYLLFCLVFSLTVPLITFPSFIQPGAPIYNLKLPIVQGNIIQHDVLSESETRTFSAFDVFKLSYFLISSILFYRFLVNMIRLRHRRSEQSSILYEGYEVVLTDEAVLPYSFLSTIYVNAADYREGRVPGELLAHEKIHIDQKHSIDIILIEFLKIFLWFNPLLICYKKAIMLNHEYLADEAVIRSEINSNSYIDTLLRISFRNNKSYLASSFNYSFTKKRLLMITKNNFSRSAVFKKIAVAPLFLILGFLMVNAQEARMPKHDGTSAPPPGYFDFKSPSGKPSAIYIDGVLTDIDISTIDLKTMSEVHVYKDDSAVKRFGEKAKDGAIEFFTRKEDSTIPKDKTIYAVVTSTPVNPKDAPVRFVEVEENPEFPGGEAAMAKWIHQNLKYPQEAAKDNIKGSVRVRFYVDTTGRTREPVVMKSDNPVLDDEARRIVLTMPAWKPGRQGGKLVDVYRMVTIDFKP